MVLKRKQYKTDGTMGPIQVFITNANTYFTTNSISTSQSSSSQS